MTQADTVMAFVMLELAYKATLSMYRASAWFFFHVKYPHVKLPPCELAQGRSTLTLSLYEPHESVRTHDPVFRTQSWNKPLQEMGPFSAALSLHGEATGGFRGTPGRWAPGTRNLDGSYILHFLLSFVLPKVSSMGMVWGMIRGCTVLMIASWKPAGNEDEMTMVARSPEYRGTRCSRPC